MSFRMAECYAALGMILLVVFGWFQISDLPTDARMFPAALLLIIGVLSAALLVRGIIGKAAHFYNQEVKNWRFAISSKRMLIGFAMLALYFLILPYLGFFTTSFILIISMARGAGYNKPIPLFFSAVGFCLFVYTIFVALFERPLPEELFITLLSTSF
jgi:hypothetical protein